MLKKILVLLLFITLFACAKKVEENNDVVVDKTTKVNAKDVDMSGYKNMSSTRHCFKEIDLDEFYSLLENKGSGLFYMGYEACGSCQEAVEHLNAVAQENNVTIYYINIDRPSYHIKDDSVAYEDFVKRFSPVLKEREGKKVILTPDVFQVINGKFGKFNIGLVDNWATGSENDEQVKALKDIYYNLMKPFIENK